MSGMAAGYDTRERAPGERAGRRRVLIVVSSYAPTMIADMHRARHLAWELPRLGWDVEILAPDSSYQQAICLDEDSAAFFEPSTSAHYVPAFMPGLFRRIGLWSIGWRALAPLWRAGRRLLRQRHFDVVYLSTTHFPLFLLGRLWQRELGIPYVLDFHDPCHKEPERYRAWLRPELKHVASRWLLHFVEARAVGSAAGIVSVSPDYVADLRRRYGKGAVPWMRDGLAQVIPFAVSPHDLSTANALRPADAPGSHRPRIVYVGSGGAIMRRAFALLCEALAHLRTRGSLGPDAPRIELYGTLRGWREGDRKELAEVAHAHGVGDLVDERPGWVSYLKSLEVLRDGDGALILGVDDAGYMPSKLFTYAYSGKPLLALLRREGPAYAAFQRAPDLGHALWFSAGRAMPIEDAAAELRSFLEEVVKGQTFDRADAVRPFLAGAMAARHAALFEAVCTAKPLARADIPQFLSRGVSAP